MHERLTAWKTAVSVVPAKTANQDVYFCSKDAYSGLQPCKTFDELKSVYYLPFEEARIHERLTALKTTVSVVATITTNEEERPSVPHT